MALPLPPKAVSVDPQGAPDGWIPPLGFVPQILDGGHTRLLVSLPGDRLEDVHLALLGAISGPLSVRYVQLTDRGGSGQLAQPNSFVAVDLGVDVVRAALSEVRALAYHDARHQLWVRGAANEQLVLDELGLIYLYPDDPLFRDVLTEVGVPEMAADTPTMDTRDYVRVSFFSPADAEEAGLMAGIGLQPWG